MLCAIVTFYVIPDNIASMGRKKRVKLIKIFDYTIKIPQKSGNGILRFLVNIDVVGIA